VLLFGNISHKIQKYGRTNHYLLPPGLKSGRYQIFSPTRLYLSGGHSVQPQHEMSDPITKPWSLYTVSFYTESSGANVSFPYCPYRRRLKCTVRESLLFFCRITPEKLGIRYPAFQKVGDAYAYTYTNTTKNTICTRKIAGKLSVLSIAHKLKELKTILTELKWQKWKKYYDVERNRQVMGQTEAWDQKTKKKLITRIETRKKRKTKKPLKIGRQ